MELEEDSTGKMTFEGKKAVIGQPPLRGSEGATVNYAQNHKACLVPRMETEEE
jgi:hypothetical protein